MLVKTIKDYTDKDTKEIYRVSDKDPIRKVSDERGAELIAKGVAIEVADKKKAKQVEKIADPEENTALTIDENLDAESNENE